MKNFIIFISIIFIYYIPPIFVKLVIKKVSLKKINKNKFCYLTFDDGPNPETTPIILDLLKKANIKATFFMLAENIEKYPDIVDRVIAEKHQIGEHSYKHHNPWKINPVSYILDLIKSNKIISKYSKSMKMGKVLFRPPYGKLNIITLIYIIITKKKIVLWDIDPKDYRGASGEEIVKFIEQHLEGNSIILLHDNRINDKLNSLSVTTDALQLFINKGYHKKYNLSKLR